MTARFPSVAPQGCREPRCAHLIEYQASGQTTHRCAMNFPMHDPCGFFETPEQARARARTSDALRFMGADQ